MSEKIFLKKLKVMQERNPQKILENTEFVKFKVDKTFYLKFPQDRLHH